jgi:hypothetical protein
MVYKTATGRYTVYDLGSGNSVARIRIQSNKKREKLAKLFYFISLNSLCLHTVGTLFAQIYGKIVILKQALKILSSPEG